MSPRTSIGIAIAATAMVAGAVGFFAGKSWAPTGDADPARAGSAIPRPASDRPWNDADGPVPGENGTTPGSPRRPGLAAHPPASIAAESARREGRDAIHRMLDQPGPISRWRDVMTLAETGSPDQISGALDELIGMPKGIDTIVARFFLFSRFGENDPKAALAAIESLPSDEIELARQSVLGGWAGKDPEAAAAFLLEQAESDGVLNREDAGLVRNVVDEWARIEPSAAFQWSLNLEGDARRIGVQTALGQWAARAPREAAAAAEAMSTDENRDYAFVSVAKQWARVDPQAAMAWSGTLPDEVKNRVTSRTIGIWAEREPRRAVEAIADLEPGNDRNWTVRVAAAKWSDREPREAADWVLSEPESEIQFTAIREVVRKWAQKDETGASGWLVEQSPGPAKDQAIAVLSNTVTGDDPEAAAIWANTIGDSKLRHAQVGEVVRKWIGKDRTAALTWLQGADLPETVKAKFLNE